MVDIFRGRSEPFRALRPQVRDGRSRGVLDEREYGSGPFWVYVLRSGTTRKRYVGQTDNLAARVVEHNSLEHSAIKFTTKHKGPWLLVHAESHPSRGDAMRRERWLKSGAGRDWLDRLMVERSAAAD